MAVEYTGVYWGFEREAAVGGYREGYRGEEAQREGGTTAPWQARRSYAGDIGALYLRQHESQGRAQRLLGLEMPQPANPPCRRHAAPLPRDAATRESAMPPPRRPPCRSVATPTARRASAGYTSGCASAGVGNTKKPRILISQSPGPGHGQAGLCAVVVFCVLCFVHAAFVVSLCFVGW